MKTRQNQHSLKRAAGLLALSVGFTLHVAGHQALAQYQQDPLLAETEGILADEQVSSPTINIDGRYSKADRAAKMRKQLEQQSEDMVQTKIEDIRIKQEKELAKGLKKAFTRGMQAMGGDNVATQTSAVQKTEAQAPAPQAPQEKRKENRIAPTFGVTNVAGDKIDFESKIATSVGFETDVSDHFSAGIGLGFMTMDIEDLNTAHFGGFNSFNQTEGREMQYKQFSLDLNGKFYFVANTSKIRPYTGLSLGYRRSSLDYQESDPYYNGGFNSFSSFNNQSLEDVSYKSNYATASAQLGADMNFSQTIGARLQVGYTKGLFNDEEQDSSFNETRDEANLRNVGTAIADADFITLGAGLIVNF